MFQIPTCNPIFQRADVVINMLKTGKWLGIAALPDVLIHNSEKHSQHRHSVAQHLLSDIPVLHRETDDFKQWMWAPSSHCEVWCWASSALTDLLKDEACLKIESQMPPKNKKGNVYLNPCLKYWRESLAPSLASWHYLEKLECFEVPLISAWECCFWSPSWCRQAVQC